MYSKQKEIEEQHILIISKPFESFSFDLCAVYPHTFNNFVTFVSLKVKA